jgi:spermidine/putrescine transport system ATP-binding protein
MVGMAGEKKAMVELVGIEKFFGSVGAVKGVSLEIYQGEFLTLLGPSGCGKTTTLRMIGGFEEPDRGDVLIDGVSVRGKKPFERDVNTVFQSYALFPHMSVFQNVAFGLKMKGVKEKEYRPKVEEALKLVKMETYADRLPKQLSGGEQQRVAVARAIVNNPRVLLLDEPLGALDLKLRKQMQVELKHLQKRLGMTFVYVTHDQEEALVMSDRVAVMNSGLIEQVDSPRDVYRYPRSRFVADFIGDTNLLDCVMKGIDRDYVLLEHGETIIYAVSHYEAAPVSGQPAHLSIRPEDITILGTEVSEKLKDDRKRGSKDHLNVIPAVVEEVIFVGSTAKIIVRTKTPSGFTLTAHAPISSAHAMLGQEVYVSWEPDQSVFTTE